MTTVTLTEEQRANLTLWIEKLESGEYKQVEGKLRRGTILPGYCCLGVYADIKGAQWNYSLPSLFIGDVEIGEYLKSDWFEKQTGLSSHDQGNLSDRNDSGENFKSIAFVLRKFMETGDPAVLVMDVEVGY